MIIIIIIIMVIYIAHPICRGTPEALYSVAKKKRHEQDNIMSVDM